MRRALSILILCLIIVSCGHKESMPGNVLPPLKMQEVMWDVMRADQFLSDYVFLKDSALNKDKASLDYYRVIFKRHGITHQQFQESFAWYREHPAALRVVMDSIVNRKELKPEELYKPKLADTTAASYKQLPLGQKDSTPALIPKIPRLQKKQ